ncbi:HTH-type transcriptional activator HxlR [compost metagenome]
MLIQHLKQLENDRLLVREAKPVVPPYVTYTLTEGGRELESVINAMAEWAYRDMKRNDLPVDVEMAA